MRRLRLIAGVGSLLFALPLVPVLAQDAEIKSGVNYTCEDGIIVENAIEITVNVVDYTFFSVFAHGLDGFDPVLVLINEGAAEGDNAEVCVDGTFAAAESIPDFGLNLPDIGEEAPAERDEWATVYSGGPYRILVGGDEGQTGEVVLTFSIFTPEENALEFFNDISLLLTPNLLASETPLSLYAFPYDYPSVDLDPMLEVIDPVNDHVLRLRDVMLACATVGVSACYGNAETDLSDAYIGVGDGRVSSTSNSAALTLTPEDVAAIAEAGDSLTIRLRNFSVSGEISFITLALHLAIRE